ncbi:SH3 beta-barrel fold-containing protein [uncultured Bacteroides sp.]|uniref:SH3 beta-barrel fold-containing protein n=1 Tax=uncultured Bacteroides sp. TaxID=162156 RepID=UPI00261A441D|nr:SH3 beta-barrel fold-containing protein [uncultured Bacteroides sp.]
MATNFKNQMRELMKQAWMLVKVYGFSMADAMKQAWQVLKLKAALKNGVVKFFYQKLNGEIRTAWGTLKEGDLLRKLSLQLCPLCQHGRIL